MRALFFLLFLSSPVAAWEFSATPICQVTHQARYVSIDMTYDHRTGLYALSLTRKAPWPADPIFSIHFDGPMKLTISTDRQVLSEDRLTLTAADTGFGNVLNGLEFNQFATPQLGSVTTPFGLSGSAPSIQAFRACTEGAIS